MLKNDAPKAKEAVLRIAGAKLGFIFVHQQRHVLQEKMSGCRSG